MPALLLDGLWDVVDTNDAVQVLVEGCDPSLLEPPVNALRLTLHPQGLAPHVRNLPEWSTHLLRQVRHRAERTHDPRLEDLFGELTGYVGSVLPTTEPATPVIPLQLDRHGKLLHFFSVASQLETPTDTTLEGLVLETFVPADSSTREALADLK